MSSEQGEQQRAVVSWPINIERETGGSAVSGVFVGSVAPGVTVEQIVFQIREAKKIIPTPPAPPPAPQNQTTTKGG